MYCPIRPSPSPLTTYLTDAPPVDQKPPTSPQGTIPQPFSYEFSKTPAIQYSGGSVKIADSTVFNVATEVAVAEVTVEPGAMRELHWHPTESEWGYFLCARHHPTLDPMLT